MRSSKIINGIEYFVSGKEQGAGFAPSAEAFADKVERLLAKSAIDFANNLKQIYQPEYRDGVENGNPESLAKSTRLIYKPAQKVKEGV